MKKKHPEHVNLERWLVSFADFMTLLFALFVVLFAYANQDKAKIKQITESIQRAFNGPSTMLDTGTGSTLSVLGNPTTTYGLPMETTIGRTNAAAQPTPELVRIAAKVEESIAFQLQTTDLKDSVRVIYDDRGLVIRFSASKLFPAGEEYVDKAFLPLINKIGEILISSDRVIRVEGHTDDRPPLQGTKFPTNWELSTARAAWIVRFLRARLSFPAARLSAAGYAEGQPISNNDTAEGRSLNNRVEFVITNLAVPVPKE